MKSGSAMPALRPHNPRPSVADPQIGELHARWMDRYGPVVTAQLEPDRRYSLIKVGTVQFAYTTHERHVRALRAVWEAGLVPEPLPTVAGSALLDVAPNLQGVDADLDALRRSDVKRPSRFA